MNIPFVFHTRILGRVVIPWGTTGGFFVAWKYVSCLLVGQEGERKQKKKEKRKKHFVLCLINFV
jgi:hypothetical protein